MVRVHPNDFWRQTWRENALVAEAYHNRINLQWEQTRYVSTMIHNANCQKRSQMIKPEKLFELPIDRLRKKERDKPKSTDEQRRAFEQKIKGMTVKKTLK